MLDLKAAMMPIVSFARLYALKHEIRATGTLDRLAALAAAGAMTESGQSEMATAYESLMHLRLRNQAAAFAGRPIAGQPGGSPYAGTYRAIHPQGVVRRD